MKHHRHRFLVIDVQFSLLENVVNQQVGTCFDLALALAVEHPDHTRQALRHLGEPATNFVLTLAEHENWDCLRQEGLDLGTLFQCWHVVSKLLLLDVHELQHHIQASRVVQLEPKLEHDVLLDHHHHLLRVVLRALAARLLLSQHYVFLHLDSQHEAHDANQLIDLDLGVLRFTQVEVAVDDSQEHSLVLKVKLLLQL